MRRIFRRSILWFLPVVIIPLGALLILQVHFLRSLEERTVSAERNWMRNSLELVTSELESRYRTASEAALSLSETQLKDVTNIGRHFAKHQVPGARAFFSMSFKEDMYDSGFFDGHGQERHPTHAEADAVVGVVHAARITRRIPVAIERARAPPRHEKRIGGAGNVARVSAAHPGLFGKVDAALPGALRLPGLRIPFS